MGFEVVKIGQWTGHDPLPKGAVALGRNGTLLVHAEDLARVKIKTHAILLADPMTFRLGLRAPRAGEEAGAAQCYIVARKDGHDTGRRRLRIARALARLSLTSEVVRGRYELHTHASATGENELLFFTLTEHTGGLVPESSGTAGAKRLKPGK